MNDKLVDLRLEALDEIEKEGLEKLYEMMLSLRQQKNIRESFARRIIMDCPKKDCILRLPDGYTTTYCIDCGPKFLNYETENHFSKRTEQEANKNFEKTCIDTGINIDDLFDKIVDNDKRYELVQKLSNVKKFIHFCVTDFLKNYDNEENKELYIEYLDLVMNMIEKEQFRIGISETGESQRGNL